jgi:PAS domain S-box-containing protein
VNGGLVLVVGDDAINRGELVSVLVRAAFQRVFAVTEPQAFDKIQRSIPSLVVLDAGPRSVGALELLRRIRNSDRSRDIPVIAIAEVGSDEGEAVACIFDAGADDLVRTPYNPIELIARIRGQLRARGIAEALAKKERDARIVLELTQALASNLDFRGILFTVVQRIADVARVDRVSIVLVSEGDAAGYVVAASDDPLLRDLPIDLSKYPEILQVLSNRQPLVISDVATHPLLEVARLAGTRTAFSALALLPILYESRPMGVLFLRAKHQFPFGAQELELCSTVSSAMAIALRNARVLQTLRDQTKQVAVARVEAERRLLALQRYADFFESAADGTLVIDSDGALLFSNPSARAITGHSESDLQGFRLVELVTAEDRNLAIELVGGFVRGQYPKNIDLHILRKNGERCVLSVNFNSVLREEGVVLCSFRDVTADREVEHELKKTRDFLQRVVDASVDAIVTADLEGRVLLANPAAEQVYGVSVADLRGRDVRTLYPEGGAEEVMRLIRAGGGQVQGLRTDVLAADGERVPVSLFAALLHEENVPIGTVGIFTDLREKMRMEHRLAQVQAQLLAQERQAIVAELAGAAAHELNQPLTSVLGYAELLKRHLDRDTEARSAAEIIYVEAERMAEIVRKIGRITKYETKSYVGQARILDLDRSVSARSDDDAPEDKRGPERG